MPLLFPILYALLGGLVALLLLLLTTRPDRPPEWRYLLCFVGFVVSIAWISSIANEVVGVLKALGVVLGMSDAILGLTIFAVVCFLSNVSSVRKFTHKLVGQLPWRPGCRHYGCAVGISSNGTIGLLRRTYVKYPARHRYLWNLHDN